MSAPVDHECFNVVVMSLVMGFVGGIVFACWMRDRAQRHRSDELHSYLSTACWHGEHEQCRQRCKFCEIGCICKCHHTRKQNEGDNHGEAITGAGTEDSSAARHHHPDGGGAGEARRGEDVSRETTG